MTDVEALSDRAVAGATPSSPSLIAHRGRAGDDPENTVEALEGLPPWVDGVEVDVRTRADGVCVLMHDAKVDRTTSGSGRVANLDREAMKRLRVGGRAPVPTLKRYLHAVAKTWLDPILIDLKESKVGTAATATEVVASSPAASRCVVLVRSLDQLRWLGTSMPSIRTGYLGLTRDDAESRFQAAEDNGAELLLIYPGDQVYLDNRTLVAEGRRRGHRVGASTINGSESLLAAYEDGCAVVLTDRVAEVGRGRASGPGRPGWRDASPASSLTLRAGNTSTSSSDAEDEEGVG